MVCLAIGQIGAGKLEMGDLERTPDGKFTPTFEIKDVLDSGTLLLKNNIAITLVGIKRSQSLESVSFIKKLVSKRRIAFVSDKAQKGSKSGLFYAYLLGPVPDEFLPKKGESTWPDMTGFTDLKVGFNVAKSITYNLNTILLRAGYAEVDRTYPFEHLAYFEKCEEEAKQNQRGLWKNVANDETRGDDLTS